MTRCEMCGYYWFDSDENGDSYGRAYCHYEGPPQWAPCEQDDNWIEPEDYRGDRDEWEG